MNTKLLDIYKSYFKGIGMKKNFLISSMALLIAMSTITMTACDSSENTDSTTSTVATTTVSAEAEATTQKDTPAEDPTEATTAEPAEETDIRTGEFSVTDISGTQKSIYVYRDDIRLYGEMCLPEGDGPFPVVILSSGYIAPCSAYSDIASNLAENGIVGVYFDCSGNCTPSKSDGSTLECSVLTEAADLEAVIRDISTLEYIDSNNIFLWGHSLGGFVTAYVGCENPELIRGMMLAEPSFQIQDEFREEFPEGTEIPEIVYSPMYVGGMFFEDALSFDIFEMLPNYSGNVVIYAGTTPDSIGGETPEYFDRAIEVFPSAELISLEGSNHNIVGTPRYEMMEMMIEFVNTNVVVNE